MALTLSDFEWATKELYSEEKIERVVYAESPGLGMIKKDTDLAGEHYVQPVVYNYNTARSADFSTALGNLGSTKGKSFNVTPTTDYAVMQIARLAYKAARNDKGAMLRTVKHEMDGAMDAMKHSLGVQFFGAGDGVIGQRASISTATVTLSDANDISNFEVGMSIVAAATKTGALRSGVGVITLIDRDAGTFTYSGTITSFADNDYLFQEGDAAAGGDLVRATGLAGWIPSTAPTSGDSFFSVDRTADVQRLAGQRYNGAGETEDEAVVNALVRASEYGGCKIDCVIMSHARWASLANILDNKVRYKLIESPNGRMSWEGFEFRHPKGQATVLADVSCPDDKAYGLMSSTWTCRSMGPAPTPVDDDGVIWRIPDNADGIRAYLSFFGNFSCSAPGYNTVIYNYGQ